MKPVLKIEIWSDVACPFCYIGRAHLMKALEKFEHGDAVEVEWKSFILDPTLPSSTDRDLYSSLAERKGMPLEQVMQMTEGVNAMAAKAGLSVNFDEVKPVTTFEAHKMLQLAKCSDLGDDVKLRLFQAYFEEGANPADAETLVQIGTEAGLKSEDIRAALGDPAFAEAVNRDVAEARSMGISGVPYFVIDRKYALSGAQPVATMLQAVEQAFSEKEAAPVSQTEAASCKPEGNCD
ncbi:MAG: DsbA family oxidoreductase [Cryomorphaceae bacterium]|nr:DsbA family oxidoreductase [Flavobacteriales bacterium]